MDFRDAEAILDQAMISHPVLIVCREGIMDACRAVCQAILGGGKVLVCGNGGSSADAAHIVGELMKGFLKKRPVEQKLAERMKELDAERGAYLAGILQMGLPAIDLTAHGALMMACANDLGGDSLFAQQVMGYGQPGDVLIGLSTSGNAGNVMHAFLVGKAKGLTTIALTGEKGGLMGQAADIAIRVPSSHTPDVQELHLPVYHALCAMVEAVFYKV